MCKPLLEVATKELFRQNAFRLLDLAVDTSTRDITKRGVKLKQMTELGLPMPSARAFPISPTPGDGDIRNGLQRLQDPERRFIDEFFWFWPEVFGQSVQDAAILALREGDSDAAARIWFARESDDSQGIVAVHNLAVMWLMTSLESEAQFESRDPTKVWSLKLAGFWTEALSRWERVARSDLFWDRVQGRIRQLDDPRLTTGFGYRLRGSLPTSLAKITGELGLGYAKRKCSIMTPLHASIRGQFFTGLADMDKVAELVLERETAGLRAQMGLAERDSLAQPSSGAKFAKDLAKQAKDLVDCYDWVCGQDSRFRIDLFDEIADVCNKIQVACTNANGDETECREVLNLVRSFTTFLPLQQQIEKNIQVLSQRISLKQAAHRPTTARPPEPENKRIVYVQTNDHAPGTKPKSSEITTAEETAVLRLNRILTRRTGHTTLESLLSRLKGMETASGSPEQKLGVIHSFWINSLEPAIRDIPPELDAYWLISEAVVVLLRKVSYQAAANKRDLGTAILANGMALKIAKSPVQWNLVKQDEKVFRNSMQDSGGFSRSPDPGEFEDLKSKPAPRFIRKLVKIASLSFILLIVFPILFSTCVPRH